MEQVILNNEQMAAEAQVLKLVELRAELENQFTQSSILGTTSDTAQLAIVLLHKLGQSLQEANSFEEFKQQGGAVLEGLSLLEQLRNDELTVDVKPMHTVLAEMVERSEAVATLLKKYQRV
ncbi:hypothetical protein [Pseudoalteromonas sp. T1lg23B]|uniref:hypothetical protein n=1 Tax=Pseudoalteromonas sp. T1lg23B TaxID=2077097 RepID=UPI000CF74952|nr:hypothetical protein [Pseudoalteromonas sp. T1lg23B]